MVRCVSCSMPFDVDTIRASRPQQRTDQLAERAHRVRRAGHHDGLACRAGLLEIGRRDRARPGTGRPGGSRCARRRRGDVPPSRRSAPTAPPHGRSAPGGSRVPCPSCRFRGRRPTPSSREPCRRVRRGVKTGRTSGSGSTGSRWAGPGAPSALQRCAPTDASITDGRGCGAPRGAPTAPPAPPRRSASNRTEPRSCRRLPLTRSTVLGEGVRGVRRA